MDGYSDVEFESSSEDLNLLTLLDESLKFILNIYQLEKQLLYYL